MPATKIDPPCLESYILDVCGKKGLKVAQEVGDGATDENIEKKTKIKMAEIRATLNQLHEHGIVEYNREKNMANGWFTYTWKINPDRAMKNFLSAKKKEYEQLQQKATAEEGAMFYKCRKSCLKVPFDEAMEAQFKCPECNGKMKYASNQAELKELRDKISTVEKILSTP